MSSSELSGGPWRLKSLKLPRELLTRLILTACAFGVISAGGTVPSESVVSQVSQGPSNLVPTPTCPVGSSWDRTSGLCVEICLNATGASDGNTNSACKTRADEKYNSGVGSAMMEDQAVVDEPLVPDLKLPACKEIVLVEEEFELVPGKLNGSESERRSQIRAKIGTVPAVISEFSLATNNLTAKACYPLSPQILQCRLRRLKKERYVLLPGRFLMNVETNDTIDVRDYYTTSTDSSSDILACNDSVNPSRKLRCNWIDLRPSEYRFLDPDNLTLWLPATNHTIYRPTYRSLVTASSPEGVLDSVSLCFPLTPNFTWCSKYVTLKKSEFELMDDHRLSNLAHSLTTDLGEFFILPSNGLPAICMAPQPKITFQPHLIHSCLYVISAACLLIAFVIHLIVPSLNYHAKPLLCHMFSMFVMYVGLATRKFLTTLSPTTCYSLFIVTYLSALASFFWLSVLSYDLWSIFNNLQTTSRFSITCCRFNKNRFYLYSLYAWGIPVVLCVTTVVLDTHPYFQDALNMYPGIPELCWFSERKSAWLLLYVPMFAVLAGNLTLFIWTVWNLRQASKGAEVVNKKLNQQLLFVCFKLFVVMGLCWILEAISFTFDAGTSVYWYFPDAINAIQGIIVFIIYICKPATYKLLRNKFFPPPEGKWTTDFNASKGNDNRYSSGGMTMTTVAVDRDNSVKERVVMPPKSPTNGVSAHPPQIDSV